MATKKLHKKIRKEWERYMSRQLTNKVGEANVPKKFTTFDSGSIRFRDSGNREVILTDLGMDYRTYRMKYNTMENPSLSDDAYSTLDDIVENETV